MGIGIVGGGGYVDGMRIVERQDVVEDMDARKSLWEAMMNVRRLRFFGAAFLEFLVVVNVQTLGMVQPGLFSCQ